MRLGLSQATYRWTAYPQLRWDLPYFGYRGMPLPYGSTVQPPKGIDGWLDWILDKCASFKLSPLYATTDHLRNQGDAQKFVRKLADHGVEYIASGGGLFAGTADEWARDRERFIQQIRLAKSAGAKIVAAVNTDPISGHGQPWPNAGVIYGHFSKVCSIEEQIDRMIQNFGQIMSLCENLEVVLAFENHMDYRISEIVQVVEAVDSPCLRINYDFANSWTVIEDQVEAARLAAPYTVMTHIKDMRVQSATTTGEPIFFHAPVGYGDVNILDILDIFRQATPNIGALPHCLEVPVLPQYDPDLWTRLSIDWLKDHASAYFYFD